MHFSGTEEIAAPRAVTWAFLMDPNKVGSCGPGVQSIDVVDDDHFNARAKVGVGFITATFNVNMTFVERVPLELARISARGQAPGSAVDALGEMNLRDGPDGSTIMDWSADVNISGTLASVGARLIEGTAHKLIGQTFTCMKTKLQAEAAAAAATTATASPAAAEASPAAAAEPTPAPAPVATAPAPAEAAARPLAPQAAAPAETKPASTDSEPTRPTPPQSAPTSAPAPRPGNLEFLLTFAGPSMTNVYVVADPKTRDAVVIDPARPSLDWLTGQLKARDWHLRLIIVTHGHWDHFGDARAIQDWSAGADPADSNGAAVAVHALDRQRLAAPTSGTSPFELTPVVPAVDLVDGDHIVFGAIDLEVLHTPGHTEGSICLRTGSGGLVFSGDTLAAGSWGRTDLPGGSPAHMVESLRRLAGLRDAVRIYPGHGRSTTIGQERRWLDVVANGGALVG